MNNVYVVFIALTSIHEIKEKTFKVWTYFTLLTSLLTSGTHNILTKNTSKLKEKRCTTYNKVPLYCKEYHTFTKLFLDNNVYIFSCQKSVIFYTKPRLVVIIWPSLHPVDSNKNTMNYNNFPSNGIYKLNNKTSVQQFSTIS